MENIVYNELINRGYQVDVGMVSISEKNENENYVRKQLEVDFVCNLGYERIYIQSALNIDEVAKKEQEERSLIRIDDSFINEKRTIEIALKIDLLIWILRKLR
ncbi:MAG: hypothetical protein SOY31_04315 [Bacilli bacterium]|nr:hypothetical protein [Bacilli bacterium]MDY4828650.1 hypothetical protein [Bacilli bacterium]MDY5248191.1 hypothetical protein [Bacilli bacterium]